LEQGAVLPPSTTRRRFAGGELASHPQDRYSVPRIGNLITSFSGFRAGRRDVGSKLIGGRQATLDPRQGPRQPPQTEYLQQFANQLPMFERSSKVHSSRVKRQIRPSAFFALHPRAPGALAPQVLIVSPCTPGRLQEPACPSPGPRNHRIPECEPACHFPSSSASPNGRESSLSMASLKTV